MKTTNALLALGPLFAFAIACGGGDDDTTSPGASAGGAAGAKTTASVTFHEHVEAIFQKRCQSCHHDGGLAPFSLVKYDTAFARQGTIAQAVAARTMPPWGEAPSAECAPKHKFTGDPTLTQDEMDTVAKWVAEGAAEGDPAKAPKPISFEDPVLQNPTDALTFQKPYEVTASKSDEFVCFVIDPKLAATTWVNGVQIVPGNPLVDHHALVFVDPTGESKKLADADGKYPCFGGPKAAAGGLFAAWAPGVPASDFGDDIALEVPAGALFVLQMHYHPQETSSQPDQTKVVLRRTEKAPKYLATTRLIGNSSSASGFIKLLPGPNDPASGPDFFIPAGAKGHTETMEFTIPKSLGSARLLSAGSHMHWVGKNMRIKVRRPDGTEECLLQTPRYDFNWQRGYAYDAPIGELPVIEAGDTLNIQCTYDNSMDNLGVKKALEEKHLSAPVDVTLGEETLDEMCLGAFTFLRPFGN